MLKTTVSFRSALVVLMGLSLYCTGASAQGHDDGHRGNGQIFGHGNRHYYHNGNWNRNGWFGWGVAPPVMSNGVLVASLPPGYTTVVVGGNPYFYGNDTYFRQLPSGGYTVVTIPVSN